jgi:Immunity protein 26
MKRLYSEGTVFSVPLRDRGYARGVIARITPRGTAPFGYFFGPRLPSREAVKLNDLKPRNAILRVLFGELGLLNGEWTLHGKLPVWNRSEWPMPDFVMRDPLGFRKPVLVRYSDTDPTKIVAQYPIDDDRGMPDDSTSGYGAVEIKLTRLLKSTAVKPTSRPAAQE